MPNEKVKGQKRTAISKNQLNLYKGGRGKKGRGRGVWILLGEEDSLVRAPKKRMAKNHYREKDRSTLIMIK